MKSRDFEDTTEASTPPNALANTRRLLNVTRRLNAVLDGAHVERSWLDGAIRYQTDPSAESRCQYLSERLHVDPRRRDEKLPLWTVPLGPAFPLNLTEFLLYLPDATQTPDDVVNALRGRDDTLDQVTLILHPDARVQNDLHRRADEPGNLQVAPAAPGVTRLLLAPRPLDVLAEQVAAQVDRTRVSPYQTSRGVEKSSFFFGRRQLLADVLNRRPDNYFLVGGRQVGKSSLLKAVSRRYEDDPRVRCHYVALSTGKSYDPDELPQRLARELGLPMRTPFDDVLETLAAEKDGHRLVLVDEADAFVRHDGENGYDVLGRLRGLSEEGRCYFILAGFWELYDAVVLDYQSPLKNFGETLTVGALEEDACVQLATVPMERLGIGYEDGVLVERIVRQSGRRANLVALVCHEMIKALDSRQRILREDDVERALQSDAVDRAFGGWTNLAAEDSRLDQLVVYATVEDGTLTQASVLERLGELGENVAPERVQRSLDRLELAFVLGREGERYSYRVPLFVERLLKRQPAKLLERTIASG